MLFGSNNQFKALQNNQIYRHFSWLEIPSLFATINSISESTVITFNHAFRQNESWIFNNQIAFDKNCQKNKQEVWNTFGIVISELIAWSREKKQTVG